MPFTSLIFDTAAKSVRPIESAKLGQKVRIAAYAQKSTKQKSRTKKKAIARVVKSSYLPLFKPWALRGFVFQNNKVTSTGYKLLVQR